ncbi:hypothetical protein BABINDRAFT_158915 [Babjeviella inositovora NRRL Y-12698]|uniref:Extracellular membrane protein CFEM domain-containing protein n=1 Tax=Babjeviella inositovora NRRL Y-12698 TaxID=984486 RepID=A0A1E3QXA5_9ASCO|nr:uncharacterized protein BABINDRAFT_158915 [Babjeviella inositovora NRRL Y-12698]ODQ82290.1 hypothetical protein BABINDRAFT_158915 [Babjeviella inositovora NRRL Y-12698]
MKLSIPLIALAVASQANAVAAPEGMPAAFAAAAASYQCHLYCGNAILESRTCSGASGYDTKCLCAADSAFTGLIKDCLDCAWCLWDDYSKYLVAPLAACNLPTVPTGTECSPGATKAAATTA